MALKGVDIGREGAVVFAAIDCARAYAIKENSLEEVMSYDSDGDGLSDWGDLSPGQQNAFRHSYWMASMTLEGFSYDQAILLGVAHELDAGEVGETWGTEDSLIDLINNDAGA